MVLRWTLHIFKPRRQGNRQAGGRDFPYIRVGPVKNPRTPAQVAAHQGDGIHEGRRRLGVPSRCGMGRGSLLPQQMGRQSGPGEESQQGRRGAGNGQGPLALGLHSQVSPHLLEGDLVARRTNHSICVGSADGSATASRARTARLLWSDFTFREFTLVLRRWVVSCRKFPSVTCGGVRAAGAVSFRRRRSAQARSTRRCSSDRSPEFADVFRRAVDVVSIAFRGPSLPRVFEYRANRVGQGEHRLAFFRGPFSPKVGCKLLVRCRKFPSAPFSSGPLHAEM